MHFNYLHVFWLNDMKFNPNIIEMINNTCNGFNAKEHCFATPHRELFSKLTKRFESNRILLINEGIREINEKGKMFDLIIFHSSPAIHQMIKLKSGIRKKIIWRTWGHDVDFVYNCDHLLKKTVKKILYYYWRKEVRSFRGVGIANIVDQIDIQERFGNVNLYLMPYSVIVDRYSIIEKIKKQHQMHSGTNVLVGHSGHPEDNHIEIMKLLKKYYKDDIHIFLIASYGNPDTISSFISYADDNWSGKVTIIKNFLSTEEFALLMNKMDIAILDSKRSYALGTLSYLLAFHKKVYLNPNGVLNAALNYEKVPHGLISDIPKQSFSEFVRFDDYSDIQVRKIVISPIEEEVNKWRNIFNEVIAEKEKT